MSLSVRLRLWLQRCRAGCTVSLCNQGTGPGWYTFCAQSTRNNLSQHWWRRSGSLRPQRKSLHTFQKIERHLCRWRGQDAGWGGLAQYATMVRTMTPNTTMPTALPMVSPVMLWKLRYEPTTPKRSGRAISSHTAASCQRGQLRPTTGGQHSLYRKLREAA